MLGRIITLDPDENYKFNGQIEGEDRNTYYFNVGNWLNKDLNIEDISVGQSVEFELKPPSKNGVVFPKSIRFPGEGAIVYTVKHSHGNLQSFVFIRTAALIPSFSFLIREFDSTNLFKRIATTYNDLCDDDFVFTDYNGESVVLFPSGITSDDGNMIQLCCTKNTESPTVEWYCDCLFCDNKAIGWSVFKRINANWYDIESDLVDLLPDLADDMTSIIEHIEQRCIDNEKSWVALNCGKISTIDCADLLHAPTGYHLSSGEEIYLRCSQRKGIKGYGWYYDCLVYEHAPIDVYDKKNWLGLWARFEDNEYLEDLANKTLEERWSFGTRTDYGILRNYLVYTFAHQWKNGNIAYSSNGQYAAFNTGLPDRNTYKYLYAFFERIDSTQAEGYHPLSCVSQYRFRDFVIQGRGGDGKVMSSSIRPLPSPPQYFEARSATVWELEFNDSNQITVPEYDDSHILIQRCDRLPIDFYRYPATRSKRLNDILDAEIDIAEKYKRIREYFKPAIMDNEPDAEVTQVYRLLSNALDDVIGTAVRKLSWNWRAVVPCYNPERNEPCFLLPVSFCDPIKPDRAMIASAHRVDDELIYTIHTVIPLDWAYLDARLVCRPESEWLAAECIS